MLVENALNDVVLVLAVFTNELIFAPIGNGLTELGTAIGGISPVLEPIGTSSTISAGFRRSSETRFKVSTTAR